MNIRFTPEATQELVEARAWYDERRKGIGEEFQRSFDAASASVQEHPEAYAVVFGTRRRVFIRRFPYFLLYDLVRDTVVVIGCIHFARSPAVWRRRRET